MRDWSSGGSTARRRSTTQGRQRTGSPPPAGRAGAASSSRLQHQDRDPAVAGAALVDGVAPVAAHRELPGPVPLLALQLAATVGALVAADREAHVGIGDDV